MFGMKKIGLFLCVLFFSACGFEPLYVQQKSGNLWFGGDYDASITKEMAQIKVEPIGERFGQQVRNQLLDVLTPLGQPKKPKYRLYVFLQTKDIDQQAMRKDITATRERVKYTVVYHLDSENETLVNGDSIAFVSYDILANPYSTTMAQKKTEADAAKIVANDIAMRLGAYFHTVYSQKGSFREFERKSE